jgi:hypothetical protein
LPFGDEPRTYKTGPRYTSAHLAGVLGVLFETRVVVGWW